MREEARDPGRIEHMLLAIEKYEKNYIFLALMMIYQDAEAVAVKEHAHSEK